MTSYEHAVEDLQQQAVDQLTTDNLLAAIADRFIDTATDSDDPFEHPRSDYSLNPGQRAAVEQIMRGVKNYMLATACTDIAVNKYQDGVAYWGAA